MKLRVIYKVPYLCWGKSSAWVLYPFMFFNASKEHVSDSLFRHELQHVYQVKDVGWFKFYIRYLYRLIKHGYRNHPDELEAWEKQTLPLTEEERRLKDKTYYG